MIFGCGENLIILMKILMYSCSIIYIYILLSITTEFEQEKSGSPYKARLVYNSNNWWVYGGIQLDIGRIETDRISRWPRTFETADGTVTAHAHVHLATSAMAQWEWLRTQVSENLHGVHPE